MGGPSLSPFCVILLLSVLWSPVFSDDKCSITCQGSPSSPTFLNGHTYTYGVDGAVSVYLTSANGKESTVKIFGQVSVTALGNCAHVLNVKSLSISGPDGKKFPCPKGFDKPVRFSLEDGRVGPQICADESDTRRSLNIKRAIISLLQTNQKTSTETDFFGACPTDVSSSKEGGAVLIHRSRDLSRCAHREQGKNDFLTAVYNPSAEIRSTNILRSTMNVESKVNNGIPEKITATEEYLYSPFSVGENGARAKVHTKLNLAGTSQGGADAACPEARTIIFENPHGVSSEQSNLKNAINAVKETANTLTTEASSKSAGNFAQLVRVLRTTNKDDLMKVFNQVKGRNLEKRVFLDGLFRAGTGYSIEASIQILKSKALNQLEERLVFLSLGNARHVNDEALKAAATILDRPNLPKEVYLGVGALAGAYCRDHDCHGTKPEGVVALSKKLLAKLQNCKPKNKVEEDNVVAVLKGIRNIRHLEDVVVDKLAQCAADGSNKARVRVAALDAFHADPCAAKLKKTALDLMKNTNQDSEIRIKAYLAVIECPCGQSANQIKLLLADEPVHQVGRFITSSLRHLRSSANPDKQLARQHYGQIGIPNKFNIDDRKYSSYREMSYNVDALGVGGTVEQTVIFSQDSFLPRSASLNLTAELFGHSVNVLEIGGRQGNLDRVIEHFLGPKSFLRTKKPQEIYDDLVEQMEKSAHTVESSVRGRRSIKSEVDNFDKQLKIKGISYNNELDLDIYLKLFGTDAVFLSFGDDKGFSIDNLLQQLLAHLNTGMEKAKRFQQEVRGHLLFLDAELAYPTSTGLPLKLDLVGAATARVDIATSVNVKECIKSPENAKVDIKLIPSSDVEITGVFFVDADSVAAGLKVTTNLHSSTGGHLIAKVIEGGYGFDLQFALPIDKQEILTASSDLVYFSAEKGSMEKQTPIVVDNTRKDYSGCFDQLSGMLGLTLCGEVSLPFSVSGPDAQNSISKFMARFPLSGPAKVKLVLEKNDLRGYHIKGVLRSDANQGRYGVEMLFDAEGSQNRRTQVIGDIINNNEEKSLKLSVESPIKVVSAQMALFTKPSEYALMVKGKMDDQEYYGKVGFSVQGNDRRSVFKPVAEYQLPDANGKQALKVDGQVTKETNGPVVKYTLEGVKINMPKSTEPICVDGHYSHEPKGVDLDLKVKQGQYSSGALYFNLKGHDFKSEFQNTLNPYINFKMNGHIENVGTVYHNDIDLQYGDFNNPQNKVTFGQLFKYYKKSANEFNVITKNKFEIHAVPIKAKFEAEIDPKKFEVDLEGQYVDKKADFEVEARTHIKKPGDYSVKIKGELDKHGMEAFAKRDIVSADKSNVENYIHFKNFGKVELSGVVLHKKKVNDMNVGAVGHLKISGNGKNEDVKFDVGVIENTNLYSSHAKVSNNKGEILDYLLKITRGANPTGQLKFVLTDAVAANGQFKVTDGDGKGNGMIIVDFKKAGRKIKGDVKFVAKEPVFNADVDLFLNFEKDNKDKIHFTTNNKKTDKLLDSKNKLDYAGKKSELNIHQDGIPAPAGKMHSVVELVLPSERVISFKLDRDMSVKDETYDGHAEAVLSDCPKRGAAGSTITYKTKVTNTNFDKGNVDLDGQIEFKLKDGGNILNTFVYKNTPKGENSDAMFDGKIQGSLIPKPLALVASATYTELPHMNDKYRVKASYGDDLFMELVGDFEMNLPQKGERKYLDDFTMTFRLPLEQAHDIKWVSTLLYFQPENQDAEVTLIESVQINADLYKFDSNGKYGPKAGNSKLKLLVPHHDPLIFDVNYQANLEGDTKSGNVELKAQYGKGKTASIAAQASAAPQHTHLKLSANAPQAEKFKRLDIDFNTKSPSPDTFNTAVVIDADGRVYKSDSVVVYSKSQPLFDLKYTSPDSPKQSRIYLKGNAMSSSQGKAEVKVENVRDFNMDANVEGNVQKDNVAFKFQGNAEKLGWKNAKVDISSKDAGSGKRLEFHATNDNKNILSGSTSFISKQEDQKTIIEGSGSVTLKDEQKPANFKYIRTILTEGNEQGVETFMNLALGDRSWVAESRVTNLEYKNSYLYCEEKKQCAHAEMFSKINMQSPGVIQHLINVGLDLRKLGFAPEFGLQITNEFSDKKFPQYEMNLHVNKDDKKYHLHAYSQPVIGKFPAGITVTLPQRVLALESLVQYPTNKGLPFPIRAEVFLYPDKNKPQQKTAARFTLDMTTSDTQGSAIAEIGFSHPKLGREATLKINGKVQRPDDKSLRIETSATASHPSLGGDREQKFFLEVNPVHVKVLLETPIVRIIDLEGNAVLKDNLQQAEVNLCFLEGKPVTFKALAKDFQYYEFTTGYSDEKERKLSIIGHIEPEKRLDISADIIIPGHKKNIAHGALFLKDNLVKTDYGFSKDNFNYFVNALKNDVSNLEGRMKTLGDKANKEFKSVMQHVEPTLRQLQQAYTDDLQKLLHDVSTDQTLKEISESLSHIVQFLAKMIDDVITATKPIVDRTNDAIRDICNKVHEMYEKQVAPQVKQLYDNIAALVHEYFDGLIDAATYYVALAMDFFDKYKPEIQELANVFTEIFKDLTRILVAQLKEWRAKITEFLTNLTEQIKELPIVSFIKEKWQELSIPQQLLNVLKDVHNAVRGVLPTEEVRNFADALYNYAQKKINQEKIDEAAELRVVYERLVAAASSLVKFVRAQLNELGVPSVPIVSLPFIGPTSTFSPSFGGSASFSIFNQLIRGDIPNPIELIKAYRPRSLNPLDEIPAKLRAVVINGQHIFTFDGRHLTFPGNCRYVLAHDFVDRNFTLLTQLQNGNPKALILEDKSGTTIELKENGQVTVNGANHGFPVNEKDVFAFKQPSGRIGLGSRYGLMVLCTGKLEVCYIEVNGFYLGKIRGLLGDGNNEPYDDFRLPNGKICSSEAEFGNGYRLSASCGAVKTPEHAHAQMHAPLPPACEAVFGGISPLRPLSLVLDINPFRQACVHAVKGEDAASYQQACDLARGYAALALTGLLPAVLPARCVRCTDADAPKEVGDIYEVKLPNKQADIVVTVEITKSTEKYYKDVVIPLVGSLVDTLKAKKITDIKVYLVGITSEFPYPILYDTDLKLKHPKVQFTDESRYDLFSAITFRQETLTKQANLIVDAINYLKIKLGLLNVLATYSSTLDLPLRPGAVKHFVSVVGDKCETRFFPLDFLERLHYESIMENNAITHTFVTGQNGLTMGGKPATAIYKTYEAKQGVAEYPNDACIESSYKAGGYVISGASFCALGADQQKQQLQHAAGAAVSGMLREALRQECACVYVDPFRVRSVCANKERKVAGRRKK